MCGALTNGAISPFLLRAVLDFQAKPSPVLFVGWDSARPSPGVFVGWDSAHLVEGKSAGEDAVGAELPTKLLLDKGKLEVGADAASAEWCQELGLFVALGCTEAPEEPGCHLCPLTLPLCDVCRRLCPCPRLRCGSWDPFGAVTGGAWSPH